MPRATSIIDMLEASRGFASKTSNANLKNKLGILLTHAKSLFRDIKMLKDRTVLDNKKLASQSNAKDANMENVVCLLDNIEKLLK
jgi:hypothetical protein